MQQRKGEEWWGFDGEMSWHACVQLGTISRAACRGWTDGRLDKTPAPAAEHAENGQINKLGIKSSSPNNPPPPFRTWVSLAQC